VARILNAQHDPQRLVQEALSRARQLIDADRGALFLLDPRTNELYTKMADGVNEIRISLKQGVAGWVATHNQTLLIKNAYDDQRFDAKVDKKTGYHTRNILCMPLRSRSSDVIGVAQMINKRSGVFGEEDKKTLEAFGSQTAVALENSRLYERFFSLYRYLATLQFGSAFGRTLRSLCLFSAELVHASCVCLYLHRPASRRLVSLFAPALPDFALDEASARPIRTCCSHLLFTHLLTPPFTPGVRRPRPRPAHARAAAAGGACALVGLVVRDGPAHRLQDALGARAARDAAGVRPVHRRAGGAQQAGGRLHGGGHRHAAGLRVGGGARAARLAHALAARGAAGARGGAARAHPRHHRAHRAAAHLRHAAAAQGPHAAALRALLARAGGGVRRGDQGRRLRHRHPRLGAARHHGAGGGGADGQPRRRPRPPALRRRGRRRRLRQASPARRTTHQRQHQHQHQH